MLRRIFRPKRERKQEAGENVVMRNFIMCTLYLILIELVTRR
jgi:hypothetical protein